MNPNYVEVKPNYVDEQSPDDKSPDDQRIGRNKTGRKQNGRNKTWTNKDQDEQSYRANNIGQKQQTQDQQSIGRNKCLPKSEPELSHRTQSTN